MSQGGFSNLVPETQGIYEFYCEETGIEDVEVRLVFGRGLCAKLDGLWNPVHYWHDGLTDSQWRFKSPLNNSEKTS
jgi:hypothetical protein